VKSLAAPAEAPAIEDGIYRIGNSLSSSLRFSIPDDSAKNGVAPALSKNNNYALSQLFIFTYEKGYYRIRSLVSGKSLTVDAGNVLAKARVSQRTDSSKAYQRFRITNGPGGTYQITAKAGGLALRVAAGAAASGQTIETYYPSSAKSQRFTLTPISNINLKSDMYTISPRAKDDVNLSIESSSRSDGAGASFAKGSRSFAQKFRITKKSGGSYSIENVNSQLLLTASGSDVIQTKAQKGGPTDDQLWYSDLTLGGMRFISKSTGMAMQLTGSSGNYGIKLAASSGSTKQGFVPTETELFDKGQYRIDSRSGSGSLEVEDASFFDLASVMTGEADGSGTQAWFIRENSDGTVTIRNERSGKPLEVEDSSVESGVMQNTSSGGSEQKWLLEESDKGWYTLSSAYADTYMEVDETADTNDVNVRTTDAAVGNVPNSMEWRFVPTKLKEAGPAMPKEAADAVYDEAKKHLGKKYVFGASGPKTFDCSGYIYYVMNHSGVKEMSRVTAQDIYDSCVKISKASAKRGDLIFFKNTYKTNRIVTHLGIYLGGGKMIHAGSPVQISKVNTKYFNAHFYAYGRMA
jgi:cell wall-associated NlpC family hydrolase